MQNIDNQGDNQAPNRNPVESPPFAWQNVSYAINNVPILSGVSGQCNSGQICAVLGPYKCGKTTLLNALAGRIPVSGSIAIRDCALVEHMDFMYSDFSVRDTCSFAAKMRGQKEIDLESFGLEEIENDKVGSITSSLLSAEMRKRTAICAAVGQKPTVLLLDDPFSDLDMQQSLKLLNDIRRNNTSRAVILSSRRPSQKEFMQFDKVLFLAKGHAVYFGPPSEASAYFTRLGHSCRDCESILLLLSDDTNADTIIAQSRTLNFDIVDGEKTKLLSHFKETLLLTWAQIVLLWRERSASLLFCITSLVIALLVGFLFFQLGQTQVDAIGKLGVMFFIVVYFTILCVFPLATVVPLEIHVLRAHRRSRMRASSFYLAQITVLITLPVTVLSIFWPATYFIVGLNQIAGRFFIASLITICLSICACALGLFIGALSPSLKVSQIISALVIFYCILFGGLFGTANSYTWILRWNQYLSPIFYAYQALAINDLSGQTFTCEENVTCISTGDALLAMFGLDFSVVASCLILVGFGALYMVLAGFIVGYRSRPNK